MAAVSVPRVRAALTGLFRDTLAAAPTMSDVAVTYGHPGQTIPPAFVAVAQTVDGLERENKRLPIRSTSMAETYAQRVIVWQATSEYTSEAQQAVTERVWAVADLLEAALRAQHTLGGLVTSALFTRFDDLDFLLKEGRAAQLLCDVAVNVNRA